VTLLLNAGDVRRLLPLTDCMNAVEQAFRMFSSGEAPPPAVLSLLTSRGGFHAKAGALRLAREYFALKAKLIYSNNYQNKSIC
jgi:ornithine cyclodeaminase/alanine dehydrogenase-like protein (mu-crystallin family)